MHYPNQQVQYVHVIPSFKSYRTLLRSSFEKILEHCSSSECVSAVKIFVLYLFFMLSTVHVYWCNIAFHSGIFVFNWLHYSQYINSAWMRNCVLLCVWCLLKKKKIGCDSNQFLWSQWSCLHVVSFMHTKFIVLNARHERIGWWLVWLHTNFATLSHQERQVITLYIHALCIS